LTADRIERLTSEAKSEPMKWGLGPCVSGGLPPTETAAFPRNRTPLCLQWATAVTRHGNPGDGSSPICSHCWLPESLKDATSLRVSRVCWGRSSPNWLPGGGPWPAGVWSHNSPRGACRRSDGILDCGGNSCVLRRTPGRFMASVTFRVGGAGARLRSGLQNEVVLLRRRRPRGVAAPTRRSVGKG
jgi:hypothetical protein